MSFLSDSEGAGSDFEVLTCSSNQEPLPGAEERRRTGSRDGTSALADSLRETTINEASQLLSESSSASTSVSSSLTISSPATAAGRWLFPLEKDSLQDLIDPSTEESEPWEEVREIRGPEPNATVTQVLLHPRRERRDTDRRSQRKKSTEIKEKEHGSVSPTIGIVAVVLGSAVFGMFLLGKTESPGSNEEIQKLRQQLVDLEYNNKHLLNALRAEENTLKTKYFSMINENFELKEQLKEMTETLDGVWTRLTEAEQTIQALKRLAEEESGSVSDRYGFDLPFQLCTDILDHEKLCRLLSEGLRAANEHIFE